jgi:hypothetical protein
MGTDYAGALNHRGSLGAMKEAVAPKLHSIQVIHHMTGGEPHSVMVEPGKMVQHIADCPHCGGGSEK